MTLPAFAKEELELFLLAGQSGSITLHSDGQTIKQVEVKTFRREQHEPVTT